MSDYSKLKSIEVINFMGYLKAKAVVDDGGSLNFKGYNNAGKSAILTAAAVCLFNMFPSKHAKYIHHEKEYFRIIVSFDDGISILRDKYKNGQSLYEMYRGEECIYTTKRGGKLLRVDDVPEPISNYLGLIKTKVGFLNYQVRRDPLFPIETVGSDNYYSFSEVLKTVEIARANAILNTDMNNLNSEITEIESRYNTYNTLLSETSDMGEAVLALLYERQGIAKSLSARVGVLGRLKSLISEVEGVEVPPELDKVGFERLGIIEKIASKVNEADAIEVFSEEIGGIGVQRLQSVNKLVADVKSVEAEKDSLFNAEVSPIEGSEAVGELGKVSNILAEIDEVLKSIKELETQKATLTQERDTLTREAKERGIRFVTCENCGSMMEVGSNG